jgi:methylase of polypeptide subunit release factors
MIATLDTSNRAPTIVTITTTAVPALVADSVICFGNVATEAELLARDLDRLIVESERRQHGWETTDRLVRAAPPMPRAPRVKPRQLAPAWPTRIASFRCRTRSRSGGKLARQS